MVKKKRNLPLKTPKEEKKSSKKSEIVSLEQHFTGPLPPPQILKGYEEVHPGTAERIISMAESEQQHRHNMQRKELNLFVGLKGLSMISAFLIGVCGISWGGFLLLHDKSITGLTSLLSSLVALVGVYLYDKKHPNKKDSE